MLDPKREIDPPFADRFCYLFKDCCENDHLGNQVDECELPVIDLGPLWGHDRAGRQACMAEIVKAASEWGFFQVLNHGISPELLEEMKREQFKAFELPFEKKVSCKLLNDSYRWGTQTATSLKQFSWSEAFHIPLSMISDQGSCCNGEFDSMR